MLDFYKEHDGDKVWWVDEFEIDEDGNINRELGPMLFSFDKKTIFNYWPDYPEKLSPEQKWTFDDENPFWAKFRASDEELEKLEKEHPNWPAREAMEDEDDEDDEDDE